MAMERVGLDDIKAGYAMFKGCPFYAIFERTPTSGKTGRLLFTFKDGDREQGWEELQQNLVVLENTAPTVPHIIQFYDQPGKGGKLDSNTDYAGSFVFRMKPANTYAPAINGMGNIQADNSFLNYLQTELRMEKECNMELRAEVEDLKEQILELEDVPEQKQIGGIIGQIGQAGNEFPWLQETIKDGLTILKNALKPPRHQREHQHEQEHEHHGGHSMAGVNTAEMPYKDKIAHAQRILMTWYARQYGNLETEEGRLKGAEKFADDLLLLAIITDDDDTMHLALKKLRQAAQ